LVYDTEVRAWPRYRKEGGSKVADVLVEPHVGWAGRSPWTKQCVDREVGRLNHGK